MQAALTTGLLKHMALVLRLLESLLMIRLLTRVLLERRVCLLEGGVESLHELHLVDVHVHACRRVCSELEVAIGLNRVNANLLVVGRLLELLLLKLLAEHLLLQVHVARVDLVNEARMRLWGLDLLVDYLSVDKLLGLSLVLTRNGINLLVRTWLAHLQLVELLNLIESLVEPLLALLVHVDLHLSVVGLGILLHHALSIWLLTLVK